jgi:hypothetical protein
LSWIAVLRSICDKLLPCFLLQGDHARILSVPDCGFTRRPVKREAPVSAKTKFVAHAAIAGRVRKLLNALTASSVDPQVGSSTSCEVISVT